MSRGRSALKSFLGASLLVLVVPAVVAPAPASAADDKVRVLSETPQSNVADIPPAVRNECREMGRELPNAIVRANRNVVLVKTPKELTARRGKYLTIEITQVRAKG